MTMEMFNQQSIKERIGDIKKSTSLNHLKEVEKYFVDKTKRYKIEIAYDVIANELPYFKTMNYTEWAHSFIAHPLSQYMRLRQMDDAYADNASVKVDYAEYFKERIVSGQSNKYTHIVADEEHKAREALVVLVGSNKLKERLCLNKMKWIVRRYEDDVWFKPHPLTTHALVSELKDILGEDKVLERNADMYAFMLESEVIFTSHLSESAVYAVCLDKKIEPIDLYQKAEQGSFYHINTHLFNRDDPKEWLNRTLNSPKCGIFNPLVDENWKQKVDDYLSYIMALRDKYKNKYV